MVLIKEGCDICHAALLEKYDETNFYIKNSAKCVPVIRIPRNRPTYYQQNLVKQSHEFGLSPADVQVKINEYCKMPLDWNVPQNEWLLIDTGYTLILNNIDF